MVKNQIAEKEDHGKQQAKAQIESIIEMVAALNTKNENKRESAIETIQNDPLSVEVRSNWHAPGADATPEEFKILLCWGGPACRIIGELSEYNEPEKARIEYQDWFTEWTDYPLTEEEEAQAKSRSDRQSNT